MRSLLFLMLMLMAGCADSSGEKEVPPREPQITLPVLKLLDINDQPVSLDTFKGKTIFINFWATWCRPCLNEMPSIKKAKEILEKNGVVFLLVTGETSEQINEFESRHNYGFRYMRIENIDELNLQGLPTTWIFNPRGERVFAETGARQWDDKESIALIAKINDQK